MVGYSFDHEFNDTFTVASELRFARTNLAKQRIRLWRLYRPGKQRQQTVCRASASDKGHYLARKYVVDNEKLQNFTVIPSCRANSQPAGGPRPADGVDFMRMRNDINSWFGYDDSVPLLDLYNPVNSDLISAQKIPRLRSISDLNRQKQTGLYVQDQAQWDKVLVTLGGRYDWADQESTTA